MRNRDKFHIVRTGTEYQHHNDAVIRRTTEHFAALQTDRTPAGDQHVLPGAGSDAGASLARKRAADPIRPRVPQQPCDVGLFDTTARDQSELF